MPRTKSQHGNRPDAPEQRRAGTALRPLRSAAPVWMLLAGALCLLVGVVAAGLLVSDHFGGIKLPGCGADSPCARATASVWGKLKIGEYVWPVSFMGATYFAAALVGWLVARGALPTFLRWVARLGALFSVAYVGIIAYERLFCPYCLASHAGNLLFWIIMESTRTKPRSLAAPLLSAMFVFIVSSVGLAVADAQQRENLRIEGEQQRSSAVAQIAAREEQARLVSQAATTQGSSTKPAAPVSPIRPGQVLAGRYIFGPPQAPIRIVMFTGYQCPDCLRIESQLETLMTTRRDIQVSIRHFPFNSDCNPSIGRTTQPNGCWAARAAEAAGILYGVDGFWKMHKWLFEPTRRGEFQTTQDLENGLRSLGLDPAGFTQVMQSEETARRVREDVQLAKELGLYFTPMIFVNGVELKGWHVPNALARTVDDVAATKPAPRGPEADLPPSALEKYIADWREQTVLPLAEDKVARRMGPENAAVNVVLWGDLTEPTTAEADAIVRKLVAERGDVSYTFRHYPFDSSCNAAVQQSKFPNGCLAARAAETAGLLGDNDAYWKMHIWITQNQGKLSEAAINEAAASFGLKADVFAERLKQPDVQELVANDIDAGRKLPSLRLGTPAGISSIPTIFVNGKLLPRWKLDDRSVIELVLQEASGK